MGEKASKGMNRRSFLKGGLAAGGAVVVAGLAGCAPQAGPMPSTGTGSDGLPDQWDYETDVVAIGAGAAGIAAGIEARDLGLDIIVLESQGKVGGNSAICNGGMCIPGSGLQKEQGIEDSPELMAQDLISYLGVDVYEDYIRLLAEQQGLLWDWLNDLGVEFRKESLVGTTGQSVPREHHVVPGVTITNLCDAAKERGAEFMLNTTAKHFVQDPASKMVIGVQAEDKSGKAIYLKARKGVLLCSGGYARNVDMLNKWIFGEGAEAYMETCGDAIGQDGSGILMAMEIGADTRHIDYINMLTAQNPKGTLGQACSIFHVGAIMVNKEGNRFVNEAQGYINTWVEVNAQTDRCCFQVWDQAIFDAYKNNDSAYYSMQKLVDSGLLLTADTYEDLAEQMGVPADAFVATMEKYNGDVAATGVDSVFGREHLVSMVDVPVTLDHGPYYAWETTNQLCCTKGGIKQDATQGCQAVSVAGDIIPRSYLAGKVSGYSNMGLKPGTREAVNSSGVGFGGALAFGRYCVQQMAENENWDA